MKIETDLKHNELVTGITILAVLQNLGQLDISKVLLIEPLLSYTSVLRILSNKNSNINSLEELIIKESIAFSNFNDRYYDKLILSINAIMLFNNMQLIQIKDNLLVYSGKKFDCRNLTLGNKTLKRVYAIDKLSKILSKEDASELYLSLRINL